MNSRQIVTDSGDMILKCLKPQYAPEPDEDQRKESSESTLTTTCISYETLEGSRQTVGDELATNAVFNRNVGLRYEKVSPPVVTVTHPTNLSGGTCHSPHSEPRKESDDSYISLSNSPSHKDRPLSLFINSPLSIPGESFRRKKGPKTKSANAGNKISHCTNINHSMSSPNFNHEFSGIDLSLSASSNGSGRRRQGVDGEVSFSPDLSSTSSLLKGSRSGSYQYVDSLYVPSESSSSRQLVPTPPPPPPGEVRLQAMKRVPDSLFSKSRSHMPRRRKSPDRRAKAVTSENSLPLQSLLFQEKSARKKNITEQKLFVDLVKLQTEENAIRRRRLDLQVTEHCTLRIDERGARGDVGSHLARKRFAAILPHIKIIYEEEIADSDTLFTEEQEHMKEIHDMWRLAYEKALELEFENNRRRSLVSRSLDELSKINTTKLRRRSSVTRGIGGQKLGIS